MVYDNNRGYTYFIHDDCCTKCILENKGIRESRKVIWAPKGKKTIGCPKST